jgi:hypothetical protein
MGQLGNSTGGNAAVRERASTLSVYNTEYLIRLGARSLTVAFPPVMPNFFLGHWDMGQN